MTLRFSAIIPTFNREADLERCLISMLDQDIPPDQWEVIVINDGGTKSIETVIRRLATRFKGNLRYAWKENAGPAVARNCALDMAQGDLLLFLNDDVIFAPGYFRAHLAAHERQPGHAVRGNTRWHPDVLRTPFMQWIAQNVLFYYLIDDPLDITYEYFHTLDLSVHRKWFEEDRFDESFRDASLEDTEIGVRLMKKGMRLQFAPDAICYHYHFYDFSRHLQKMKINAENSIKVVERHPELHERLIGQYQREGFLRKTARRISQRIFNSAETPDYWQYETEQYIADIVSR